MIEMFSRLSIGFGQCEKAITHIFPMAKRYRWYTLKFSVCASSCCERAAVVLGRIVCAAPAVPGGSRAHRGGAARLPARHQRHRHVHGSGRLRPAPQRLPHHCARQRHRQCGRQPWYRVPTRTGKTGKPGKMGRHFPVREKSGNFEQTGKVREKSGKITQNTGKLRKFEINITWYFGWYLNELCIIC